MYRYRLTVQTTLPADYEHDAAFRSRLEMLAGLGFWGLELNVADPAVADFERISRFLGDHGLAFSMFASGLTAKTFGLSLSHEDDPARATSVEMAKRMVDFVAPNPECGIIIGFLKGPVVEDIGAAASRFRRSLDELVPYAAEHGVMLIVEATNRYEAALANSLADAAALVDGYPRGTVKILPDTFHMNIEEPNMIGALERHRDRYVSIHYSDNNRFFPGLGGIDFAAVTSYLDAIRFEGRIGLEAQIRESFEADIRYAVRRLAPLLE